MRLVNLPGTAPGLNADETIWSGVRESPTPPEPEQPLAPGPGLRPTLPQSPERHNAGHNPQASLTPRAASNSPDNAETTTTGFLQTSMSERA